MGHSHHHLFDIVLTGFFQGQVEHRYECFGAFEREGLGAHKFATNEFFEDRCIGQACVDAALDIV